MTPSVELAAVLVDQLVRHGVREAVLAPGSRSGPLAFALHAADADGRLRLHVRIDERTAGFLALGLAKASRRPVPVVTTSGTAAVNLHPAVVEASYSGVPLLAVTADRPPELRGVGANQTIDQVELYGGNVRSFVDLPADGDEARPDWWRRAVAAAVTATQDGPVHLNVPLREPLVPADGGSGRVSQSAPAEPPWRPRTPKEHHLAARPRTVVVAGDGAGPAARTLAESAGWPLLAEPTSGARSGPRALGTYRLLLPHLGDEVERVVVVGRPTLSRPVAHLLTRTDVEMVVVRGRHVLPRIGRRPAVFADTVTADSDASNAPWAARWSTADAAARTAAAAVLGNDVTGPSIARTVAEELAPGGLLVVGSSAAVRDLDLAEPWDEPPEGAARAVLANRGASGIDGTVSTAVGAALAHGGHGLALVGDLTFLHDATGLVIGPDEPRPDLTIVVNNDDGGGIFGQLEPGAPEHAAVFERVFGTPHGVDLAALCAATGTPHERVHSLAELRSALRPRSGISVVEVRTDRSTRRALDQQLRGAVAAALAEV